MKKTKKILLATFLEIDKARFTLYAMFVNHFGHKGPRPEVRPLLMAAFYEFKAAVSDFYSAAKSAARKPACLKFSDAAT